MADDQDTSGVSTLRDARKVFHFWLDDAILDHFGTVIGPYGFMIYGYLARRAKQSKAFPSHKRIAAECGMSRAKVITTLKQLQDLGLIEIQARTSQHGDATSNLYILKDLSHLRQEGSPPGILPSPPSRLPSPEDRLPVVYEVDHLPPPGRHEVVSSLSSTRSEVEHTPSPALRADPPSLRGRVARVQDSPAFQTFPTDRHSRLALRKAIVTPELHEWARAQGLPTKFDYQFERFCDDGLAHHRRYADFHAAFRNWLTSPYQADGGKPSVSTAEARVTRHRAATTQVMEDLSHAHAGPTTLFPRP